MPIYEYSCNKCGETVEAIQRVSDPDLKKHETCGGKLNRVMSIPMVQIKGGDAGWDTRNPSVMQQLENQAKRAEKQRKTKPIVSTKKSGH